MFRRTLGSLLLHLYSLLFTGLAKVAKLLAPLHPRLNAQLSARAPVAKLAPALALKRAHFRNCAVFFCSSAGEFEQAKPLISRLQATGSVYVQVIFFSKSGLAYAQARGEAVPCMLTPVADTISDWGWLFSALRPTITCVVRHELWPGFLSAAKRFGKLYLIDASCSQGERSSAGKRWVRARLFQMFDGIFTVSDQDLAFFRDTYGVAPTRLHTVGDTKYDRVLERANEKTCQIAELRRLFDAWAPSPGKRLVFGSAYREEVTLWLGALALRSPQEAPWQVLIAPHHLDAELLDWIQSSCESAGLSFIRYSAMRPDQPPKALGAAVILIDTMGLLGEVYGTATAAFVGGALHRQVHNVLEPACHGLALAFGPFYKNSHEAIQLVDHGLAKAVESAADFAAWWRCLDDDSDSMVRGVQTAVAQLAGATGRIMAAWLPHLGS